MSGLATKIQTCLFMLHHEQLVSLNISLLLTRHHYKFPCLALTQTGASQCVDEFSTEDDFLLASSFLIHSSHRSAVIHQE